MTDAEVKEAVRKRDGYSCVECGMTESEHIERFGKKLDVHRLVPNSAYSIDGCETLCRACHGPKPKSPPGTTGLIYVHIDPDLGKAFEELLAKSRLSIKAQLEIILEKHLEEQGLWKRRYK